MQIRTATPADAEALQAIIIPIVRAGETFAQPRDMTREQALGYWLAPEHEVFVAEEEGRVLGSYYIRPNQRGGGAHVANGGYMTAQDAWARASRAPCACIRSTMPRPVASAPCNSISW